MKYPHRGFKQKLYTSAIFFLLILSIFTGFNIPTTANPSGVGEWIIDGDKIYVDDEDVYLSATPHTIGSDGWVEFELMSKTHEGYLDCVFGFNSEEAQPKKFEIWRNYTHTLKGFHWVDGHYNKTFYNCTDYENLGIENYDLYDVDYGNKNNTKLWSLTYNGGNTTITIAFLDKIIDGDDITFHYLKDTWTIYYYEQDYWDWKHLNKEWVIENYEYEGFDKWYSLEDVYIQQNKLYRARAWIDIPFKKLSRSTGKYWWSIKPSGKTVEEAIASNQFYCLDPWWNTSWNYFNKLTIDSSYILTSLQNFPLLVVVNKTVGALCDGGDSIRFLSLDNTTEFFYEIESNWSLTGDSFVWVNISEQISSTSDYSFLMYYGNADATDNQSPTDVWDSNYIMVQHLNGSSATDNVDSTSNDNDISGYRNNPVYQQTGKIGYDVRWGVSRGDALNISDDPTWDISVSDIPLSFG